QATTAVTSQGSPRDRHENSYGRRAHARGRPTGAAFAARQARDPEARCEYRAHISQKSQERAARQGVDMLRGLEGRRVAVFASPKDSAGERAAVMTQSLERAGARIHLLSESSASDQDYHGAK